MVEKQYNFDSKIYSVVACTKEDIPSHIERVLSYWEVTNTHIPTQKKLMELCIEQDTAYKVVNDIGETKAAMYLKNTRVDEATSYYMYLENKRMLAILFYYIRFTANLRIIRFTPHSKNYIPFKFLLPDMGIRMFQSRGEPIDIDVYSTKCQILYEDHYLRYHIKEL